MALRYVVNPEPMDIALVDKPAHIGIRDSQAGYGNRCLIVECGGVDVDAGLEAFRAAFPDMAVFADRGAALAALRRLAKIKGWRIFQGFEPGPDGKPVPGPVI